MTGKAIIGRPSPCPPSIMPHPEPPEYKFQKLEVYQLGLDFVDRIYELTNQLPDSERFNLRSQLERAVTSIVLNIAEGSTGQTDMEQNRFLGMALRSYLETVACMDLIERRKYLNVGTIIRRVIWDIRYS